MKRKGTMPATLSLEDAGSRGNGAQGEQAGPPGRGGGALAGVTGHPADTPDAGIFKEAAGVQQANHLALRKLPHPPGKRAQPSYTARVDVCTERLSAGRQGDGVVSFPKCTHQARHCSETCGGDFSFTGRQWRPSGW